MKYLNYQQLIPLRDALDRLLMFVKALPCQETPYFYHYLDTMKHNIELYVKLENGNMDLLEVLLQKDWNHANKNLFGIPSFDYFQKNEDTVELFWEYLELLDEVKKYFR